MNVQARLLDILDAALLVDGASAGLVQRYRAADQTLQVVAHRGFGRVFLEGFQTVRADDGTACAHAMVERRRICIRDVQTDEMFAPFRHIAADAGFRSVQSTPVISDRCEFLGVLSTYWPVPHHPATESLRRLDLYAGLLGLVLEIAHHWEQTAVRLALQDRGWLVAERTTVLMNHVLPRLSQSPVSSSLAESVSDELHDALRELRRSAAVPSSVWH